MCPAAATLVVQGLAQYYIQLAPPSSLFKGMEVFLGQKGRRHKGILCGVTTWPIAKTLLLTSQLLPMWAFLEPHRDQIKLIDSWLLKKIPSLVGRMLLIKMCLGSQYQLEFLVLRRPGLA